MEKQVKKLKLNRETVRRLSDDEVKTLAGGAETDFCSFPCSGTRQCSGCCSATAICTGCCM